MRNIIICVVLQDKKKYSILLQYYNTKYFKYFF